MDNTRNKAFQTEITAGTASCLQKSRNFLERPGVFIFLKKAIILPQTESIFLRSTLML